MDHAAIYEQPQIPGYDYGSAAAGSPLTAEELHQLEQSVGCRTRRWDGYA